MTDNFKIGLDAPAAVQSWTGEPENCVLNSSEDGFSVVGNENGKSVGKMMCDQLECSRQFRLFIYSGAKRVDDLQEKEANFIAYHPHIK